MSNMVTIAKVDIARTPQPQNTGVSAQALQKKKKAEKTTGGKLRKKPKLDTASKPPSAQPLTVPIEDVLDH